MPYGIETKGPKSSKRNQSIRIKKKLSYHQLLLEGQKVLECFLSKYLKDTMLCTMRFQVGV